MHETPPAHPRCRCVVQYREIGEPVIRQQEKMPTLTKDEEEAILRYMSSDSYGLNEALRNGEELSEEDKEWVKTLIMHLIKCHTMKVLFNVVYRF